MHRILGAFGKSHLNPHFIFLAEWLAALILAAPATAISPVEIKPGSGREAYGTGYEDPMALKQGDIVTLTDALRRKGGSWSNEAPLPNGHRPRKRLVFNVNRHEERRAAAFIPTAAFHGSPTPGP